MYFTVEEMNLICVFDTNDRAALVTAMRDTMPDFENDDMREIAQTTLAKLEGMTDEAFAALIMTPAYDGPDDGNGVS